MTGDADIARVAALVSEPARAAVLMALDDGRSLAATTLATEARVAPSTLSAHLARLVEGGLITVERSGRHRYFRLSGPEVGALLEALARIAPAAPVRSLRQASRSEALRKARTCYDHLAGRAGVALCDALVDAEVVSTELLEITPAGRRRLAALGVEPVRHGRRPTVRSCIDWSEQRPHLAGALGAALLEMLLARGWVTRGERRVVHITGEGRARLESDLGMDPAALG